MILDLALHDYPEQKSCSLYYFHGILEKALGYDIGYCFNPEELLDEEGNYKDGIYAAKVREYEYPCVAFLWSRNGLNKGLVVDYRDIDDYVLKRYLERSRCL